MTTMGQFTRAYLGLPADATPEQVEGALEVRERAACAEARAIAELILDARRRGGDGYRPLPYTAAPRARPRVVVVLSDPSGGRSYWLAPDGWTEGRALTWAQEHHPWPQSIAVATLHDIGTEEPPCVSSATSTTGN